MPLISVLPQRKIIICKNRFYLKINLKITAPGINKYMKQRIYSDERKF
jgi:hypothetical protein